MITIGDVVLYKTTKGKIVQCAVTDINYSINTYVISNNEMVANVPFNSPLITKVDKSKFAYTFDKEKAEQLGYKQDNPVTYCREIKIGHIVAQIRISCEVRGLFFIKMIECSISNKSELDAIKMLYETAERDSLIIWKFEF